MIKICVIGGGVKGCSIAALLAQEKNIQVVLIEKDIPAAGTTATNHGRLHLGTSGWRSDSQELVSRRLAGSKIMQSFPNVRDNSKKAIYSFFNPAEAAQFSKFCAQNSINIETASNTLFKNSLLDSKGLVRSFKLAEYGFNPARVCSQLLHFTVQNKGQVIDNIFVQSVTKGRNGLAVKMSNSELLNVDIVINAAGRWCSQIEPIYPDFKIEWFEWRILCCRNNDLTISNRVVAAMDSSLGDPTLIPHGRWLTIDCKTDLIQKETPSNSLGPQLRHATMELLEDSQLITPISKRFPFVLKKLKDDGLFSFAGVHGRVKNAPPGSVNSMKEHPQLENYWLTFGGQATTAVLDAAESVKCVFNAYDVENSIDQLFKQINKSVYRNTAKMAWENNPS